VNFPLFTYSVFGEKNVSQEVRNISRSCRRSRVVHRRGQTPCVQLHCSSRCLSLRSAHVRASSPLGRHGKPKALKDDTLSSKWRGSIIRADSLENLTRDLLDSLHGLSQ
jgi:hypothetical protein